jgi:hypothetical protein
MRLLRWIKNLFGQYQWYRRREPGHWELWKLPHDYGYAWLKVSACFYARGHGPDPRLTGPPKCCEHYWEKNCEEVHFHEIYELPDIMKCPVCRELIVDHKLIVSGPTGVDERPVHKICTGQLVRIRPVRKSGIPFPAEPS